MREQLGSAQHSAVCAAAPLFCRAACHAPQARRWPASGQTRADAACSGGARVRRVVFITSVQCVMYRAPMPKRRYCCRRGGARCRHPALRAAPTCTSRSRADRIVDMAAAERAPWRPGLVLKAQRGRAAMRVVRAAALLARAAAWCPGCHPRRLARSSDACLSNTWSRRLPTTVWRGFDCSTRPRSPETRPSAWPACAMRQ